MNNRTQKLIIRQNQFKLEQYGFNPSLGPKLNNTIKFRYKQKEYYQNPSRSRN